MLKFSEEETVFLGEMECKVHEDHQDHLAILELLVPQVGGPLTLDGEAVLVQTLQGHKKSTLELLLVQYTHTGAMEPITCVSLKNRSSP